MTMRLTWSIHSRSNRLPAPWPAGRCVTVLALLVTLAVPLEPVEAKHFSHETRKTQQLIRILGTTFNQEHEPIGVVTEMVVAWERRNDHKGVEMTFLKEPGSFSITSQVAIYSALMRTVRIAKLNPDSWSVSLAALLPGKRIYGESLSAMVALAVIAMARGDSIPTDRVITGTIDTDGHIGPVEGVSLKLEAASEKHLRHVLVSDRYPTTEEDWRVPFLLHVSPVGTVSKAYEALTDRPWRHISSTGS